jgi:hypothetical protein
MVGTQRSLVWNSTSTNVELFRYLSSIRKTGSKFQSSPSGPARGRAMAAAELGDLSDYKARVCRD